MCERECVCVRESASVSVGECVRACVRVCVRANVCVRACVCVFYEFVCVFVRGCVRS